MSESKPHVFISHATWRENTYQRTSQIRERLTALLKEKWEVFIDMDLAPGTSWRPAILNSLADAHAGVILFDKTAANESDWVKAEALIMCFRRAIDPNFQLIPVLLEGIRPGDEDFKIYRPFQLDEITFKIDTDETLPVDDFCTEIIANLDAEKARTTENFRGWMKAFKALLLGGMRRDTLCDAWQKLNKDANAEVIDDDEKLLRAVVQLIHYKKPLETMLAIKALKPQLDKDQIPEIKSLIKQKWVDNEVIETALSSTRSPRNKVLLIYYMPGAPDNSFEFIQCLLSRLDTEYSGAYLLRKISVSENSDLANKSIRDHIENEIKQNIGGVQGTSSNEKYFQKIKRRLADSEVLTVCYIPQALAKSEILEDLRTDYPELVFLVQVGSDEGINQFRKSGGKNLTPPLDDLKIDEYDDLCDKLDIVFTQNQ
jgi:hypothetical protein